MIKKEKPLEKSDIKAFLGQGSQFEGKLVFDEVVRMDGTFRGQVTSKDTLIVGDTADVEGEITVGTFILSGKFKGTVKARQRIELRAPAQLEGQLETPKLMIEEGVVFNGQIVMPGSSKGAAPEPAKG